MSGFYRVPEPPLDPPEPKAVGTCPCCKEDICEGEDIVEFDSERYHEECFRDAAIGILCDRYGARMGVAEAS